MDGNGGAWPIRVGKDTIGDDYTSGNPQVEIGYDYANAWMSGIDLVGHEMGHGIDDHTPGGGSAWPPVAGSP